MARSAPIRGEMPRFSAARSILALMLREMSSEYGQSPGGYVWALVQPIGIILILAVGFSLLIRAPSLGTSFILFYATGFLCYDMYNQLMRKTIAALKYSKPMLAYPRVVWLDAVLARLILNTLTQITVFCVLITGILYFDTTRTIITVQPILIGFAIAITLGLGLGLVNCLVIGVFPVWHVVWKILTRPMFIASGALFIYEDMPRAVQDILWWNPLLHATGLVRTGFYPNYEASYVSLTYCFALTLSFTALGLLIMRAWHKKVLTR